MPRSEHTTWYRIEAFPLDDDGRSGDMLFVQEGMNLHIALQHMGWELSRYLPEADPHVTSIELHLAWEERDV